MAELQLLWEDKVGYLDAGDDNGENDDVNKDDDDDDDANNDLLSVAELQLLWEDKVLMMMLKIVRLIDVHFEKNIHVSFALWCVQVHLFSLGLFYVSEFNSFDVQ